jgi:Undecaprenyl-phosphate glucose phosphotransferase
MLLTPITADAQHSGTAFFSKYAAALDIALRVGDVVIVIVAASLCHALRFGSFGLDAPYDVAALRAAILALAIFPAFGLYRSWRGESVWTEIARASLAWLVVVALLMASEWVVKSAGEFSRLWIGGWFITTVILLGAHRWVARRMLGALRATGVDTRRVVLVGATHAGQRIIAATRSNGWMGLNVVGYVQTPYDQLGLGDVASCGDLEHFLAGLEQDQDPPDQIWVALPMRAEALIQRVLDATSDKSIAVRLVPDLFGYELINNQTTMVAGVPVLTLRGSRIVGHARVVKAVMDRVFSAIILTLVSPVMLLLALGVKLSSPGPVFYRQIRVGLDGKEFGMLKFRSMPADVEKDGVKWGNAKNKRVTGFGRFIRRTSLDELPQFINVLKGELSIVGPRPERPMFVSEFKRKIPGYMHKHLVKAGITGWAQIHGLRGDTDLNKRIEYDLHYIEHWSVWLDIAIILRTPLVLLKRTNAY